MIYVKSCVYIGQRYAVTQVAYVKIIRFSHQSGEGGEGGCQGWLLNVPVRVNPIKICCSIRGRVLQISYSTEAFSK